MARTGRVFEDAMKDRRVKLRNFKNRWHARTGKASEIRCYGTQDHEGMWRMPSNPHLVRAMAVSNVISVAK